jgi:L,D-transpeptidase YbiS
MFIRISLYNQMLALFGADGSCIRRYAVSTAAKGAGEVQGSYQTPRGRHVIRAMIGRGLPEAAVFKARRPTGEIWSPELHEQFPGRDWILSRILWLSGCERGFNRLGNVDSMRRYIYIHGTADSAPMGEPCSHGCVRMRNSDVVELFELVAPGTGVEIVE